MTAARFTESVVEDAALDILKSLGYATLHGDAIASIQDALLPKLVSGEVGVSNGQETHKRMSMDEEARRAAALRRVSGEAMPQNTLADPEEIAANRRGEITPRQRAAFAEALRPRGRVELLAWFMGVLLVGLIIYAALTARPVPAFKFLAYPVLALLAIPGGVVA